MAVRSRNPLEVCWSRIQFNSHPSAETSNWAAILAQKSPQALQIAKKAFYAAADMDYHKAFEYMNEAFSRLCSTEDAKEGISAFLEKRSPDWKLK